VPKNQRSLRRALFGIMALALVSLVACGKEDRLADQTLARVDGEKITIHEFNDELQSRSVDDVQKENTPKQLLESLINRKLMVGEAERNKLDESPEVVRAISRAREQILAQAYLQNIASKLPKLTQTEIEDYFKMHPEFFSNCKEFKLDQLIISDKFFNDELKATIDSAEALAQVSDWMDKHNVPYLRRQVTRNSEDLNQEAVVELLKLHNGELFLSSEGDNRVLNVISSIKDSAVSLFEAAPKIEHFLKNKKMKEAVDAEIANLRAMATIDYIDTPIPDTSKHDTRHDR
jgi:peptidyl-prolyl cis-trans isomerase C